VHQETGEEVSFFGRALVYTRGAWFLGSAMHGYSSSSQVVFCLSQVTITVDINNIMTTQALHGSPMEGEISVPQKSPGAITQAISELVSPSSDVAAGPPGLYCRHAQDKKQQRSTCTT